MFSATSQNSLYLAMAATLVGDSVDLRAAQKAFEETRATFEPDSRPQSRPGWGR
jgi:hypothetical protein